VLEAVAASPELPAKVELSGRMAIDTLARRAELPDAKFTAVLRGNSGTPHTLAGSLTLNADAKDALRAEANLQGALDGSRLSVSLRYPVGATNLVGFAADLAALDLDSWSPRSSLSGASPSREPFRLDLAPLRDLPLQGSLTIGTLKSGTVTAKKVRIDVE